jgi:hypothetical protein
MTDTLDQATSEILLKRSWRFDDSKVEDLDNLGDEIRNSFYLLVQEHIPRNGFSTAHYEVIFYRGNLREQDLLGYDFSGSFRLGSSNKHILGKFYEGFNELLTEVRDELALRPGPLNLEVCVVGANEK